MLPALIFYSILLILLVIFPAGLILAVLLFMDHEHQLWQRVTSVEGPIMAVLSKWPLLAGFAKRFPRTTVFLTHRLAPRDPWGLPATVTALGVFLGLWFFLGVLQDLVAKDPLVILDIRLHNLVPLFRTPDVTQLMLVITELGGPTVLSLLCIGMAFLALARQARRLAATFVLALVGTGIVSVLLKVLIGHPRPIDAIVSANEASFPSGHLLSGTVMYGLLAVLLLGSRTGGRLRALGVTFLLLVIVGIGLSRLYLGVHWPSDLLGSLALALMLLPPLLFFLHYRGRIRWLDTAPLPFNSGTARMAGGTALVMALGALVVMASRASMLPMALSPARQPVDISTLKTALSPDLPRRSEDLIGGQMEPLSLVFVGSEKELMHAFTRAGWTRADLPTPVRLIQEGLAALRNQPDPTGPATPVFLADQPQYLTLEKPGTGTPSIRQRHHTRLWQTRYCLAPDCRTVWVATASYDTGLEFSQRLHLPTHRIDPVIDEERALIARDLIAVGAKQEGEVAISPPLHGLNAAGDPFHTDGRAIVIVLPPEPKMPVRPAHSAGG
ncbi:MAG: LssY C-terminal domain-containing protein [Polaromonas sp.]